MSDHESHCPFLNRADTRCSNHFGLDRLDRAFDHCFGAYQSCPTYQEMMSERRDRLAVNPGLTSTVVYANLTIRARPENVTLNPAQIRRSTEHASAA